MRFSSKACQVQKTMEAINGTEFQNKIVKLDDHYSVDQEPTLYFEVDSVKNIGK